ncbi:hypothetical protein ACJX0J_012837, partial [Zea mays]
MKVRLHAKLTYQQRHILFHQLLLTPIKHAVLLPNLAFSLLAGTKDMNYNPPDLASSPWRFPGDRGKN